MKTTLEIPDAIFRRAKAKAAEEGIPLRQFVTEAVEEKIKGQSSDGRRPWLKHFGKLKRLKKESARINRVIEQTFEKIDPEMWDAEPQN